MQCKTPGSPMYGCEIEKYHRVTGYNERVKELLLELADLLPVKNDYFVLKSRTLNIYGSADDTPHPESELKITFRITRSRKDKV